MSSAFQNYGSNGMCSVLSGPFATGSFLYTHTVLVVVVGPYMLLNSLQATSNLADCTTNTASLSCDDTTMRFNFHSYTCNYKGSVNSFASPRYGPVSPDPPPLWVGSGHNKLVLHVQYHWQAAGSADSTARVTGGIW